MHEFSTPFYWNGTSNIIIDICFSNQVTGVSSYQCYYTTSSFTSSIYYFVDGSAGAGACSQTTGTTTSRRPNMQLRCGLLSSTSTSNGISVTVAAGPSITSFSPQAGPVGSRITVNGSGFGSVNQVTFNDSAATGISVLSSTQLTAIVPAGGNGRIKVQTTDCGSAISTGNFNLEPIANLTLNVFFEGFYRGSGLMSGAVNGTVADTAEVLLASAISPFGYLHSTTGVVNTNGTGTFTFINVPQGYSYYIIVRHRNTLDTWSSAPVAFNALAVGYDFSSSASSAYGGNLKDLGGGRYGMFSGDVDKDGIVSLGDLQRIAFHTGSFGTGYLPEDLTGDLIIESADYSIVENNYHLNISVAHP